MSPTFITSVIKFVLLANIISVWRINLKYIKDSAHAISVGTELMYVTLFSVRKLQKTPLN